MTLAVEGDTSLSVPLSSDAYHAEGVDSLTADHGRLFDANLRSVSWRLRAICSCCAFPLACGPVTGFTPCRWRGAPALPGPATGTRGGWLCQRCVKRDSNQNYNRIGPMATSGWQAVHRDLGRAVDNLAMNLAPLTEGLCTTRNNPELSTLLCCFAFKLFIDREQEGPQAAGVWRAMEKGVIQTACTRDDCCDST